MNFKYMFLIFLVIIQHASAKQYHLLERDINTGSFGNSHVSIIWDSDMRNVIVTTDFPDRVYGGSGGKLFIALLMAKGCPDDLAGNIFGPEVKLCGRTLVYQKLVSSDPKVFYQDGTLLYDPGRLGLPAKHFTSTTPVPEGLKQLHVCFTTWNYNTPGPSSLSACQTGEVAPDEPVPEETECTFYIPTNNIDYGTLNQNEVNGSKKAVDFTINCSADSHLSLSFNNGKISAGNAEVDIDLGGGLAAHLEAPENFDAGTNTPLSSKIQTTLVTSSQTVTVGKHSNSAILKAEWP